MKDNKLIAEFMGLSHCEEGWITIPNENRNGVSENEISNDLQYHTSWDWLMPVIEKIFALAIADENIELFYDIQIHWPDKDEVYDAVVRFIKEYNK